MLGFNLETLFDPFIILFCTRSSSTDDDRNFIVALLIIQKRLQQ